MRIGSLSCVLHSRVEAAHVTELDTSSLLCDCGHTVLKSFSGQVIFGGQKVLSKKIKTGEQEAIYKIGGEAAFAAVVVE